MDLVKTAPGITASTSLVANIVTVLYVRNQLSELRTECQKMEESLKSSIEVTNTHASRLESVTRMKGALGRQEKALNRLLDGFDSIHRDLKSMKNNMSNMEKHLIEKTEYKPLETNSHRRERSRDRHHTRSRSGSVERSPPRRRGGSATRERSPDRRRNRSKSRGRDRSRSNERPRARPRSHSADHGRRRANSASRTRGSDDEEVDRYMNRVQGHRH